METQVVTDPKCPECGSSAYLHPNCEKYNPVFKCYYAFIDRLHTHHVCANKNCNCEWISLGVEYAADTNQAMYSSSR
jgi:hypothetical protein